MRLALDIGVENVTAGAIAAEAGVSTRTFHNYFITKEAAIIAVIADRVAELIAELDARPEGEPIWESLRHVLVASAASEPDARDSLFRQMTLIHNNIGLLHEHLGVFDDMGQQIAEVIARRTGTDPELDMYPSLQAAAAACCIKVATDRWWKLGRDADLAALVDDAFAQMRAGLPQPTPAHRTTSRTA